MSRSNRSVPWNLRGKSAVVTGGGNGIGKAICLALAESGANVAVADIDKTAAIAVADRASEYEVESIGIATDVADEKSVRELADEAWRIFSSVEILVNNAGVVNTTRPLVETTAADFNWIFAVNVAGTMNGIRTFVPRFIQSKQRCHIVNTASEHAFGVPHLGTGIYTASKHAVLGLSDVLRRELPAEIGLSVLCPGIVDSTLWRSSERRQKKFGGVEPVRTETGEFMSDFGMSPDEVARRVVEGICLDYFLIVTHSHTVEIAEDRWQEVAESFAVQAPRHEGDEKYDLGSILGTAQN